MESKINGSDKNVACMEEDIKLVEELIKEYKLYGDLDGIAINDMSAYINAIEHLIKAYKEEKEENKKNRKFIDEIQSQKADILMYRNVIPVSLVEEKIKELDKEIECEKTFGNVAKREELETKKKHFLEILEENSNDR